jgi:hypothetical protein
VTDLPSLQRILSTVDPAHLRDGIAPRYDLGDNPKLFGLIDNKVVNRALFAERRFWARAGPPSSSEVKPFTWKDWPNVTARHGMPDQFEYDWTMLQFGGAGPAIA